MPQPKAPHWTSQEIAILHDVFPGGGIQAAADALPDRSWQAINVMASKLGIRSGRVGDAPSARLQGAELEEAIRLREQEGWSFAKIGLRFDMSESAASNAVLIALCPRKGFTPAQRDAHGHLLPEGLARLRLALRRGIKPVEIQLRLGLSASRIAEERRRYARELKAAGKVPLPPPGAGETYSGRKIPRETSREVEALLLQGYGAPRIVRKTGVSNTHVGRIRNRLVKRLARKGECLPGCDVHGVRRQQIDHPRHVKPETIALIRAKLLEGLSIARTAKVAGVGGCKVFAIRKELVAELAAAGSTLPPVKRLPAIRRKNIAATPSTQPVPRRPRTFEEQLAAAQAGARVVPVQHIRRPETVTIGGSSLA